MNALLRALGLCADSQGTMNNVLFGGEAGGHYETICGGAGAIEGFPGADAVHTHMTNTAITDCEVLERRFPVRVERFAVRRGSGGRGRWRGVFEVTHQYRFAVSYSKPFFANRELALRYLDALSNIDAVSGQFLHSSFADQTAYGRLAHNRPPVGGGD